MICELTERVQERYKLVKDKEYESCISVMALFPKPLLSMKTDKAES